MKRHLKRLAAPRSWKIKRKENVWVVRPGPGPHSLTESVPLLLIVRDFLGYASNSREAKKIIGEGNIAVDNVVRKDPKFPVGLMDIIEIQKAKQRWIVVYDKKGRITLKELSKRSRKAKLCKIVNKTVVKGGNIQLNLHDGRNLLIKVKDPRSPKEDVFKVNDTLFLDTKKNSIVKHIEYKEGNTVLVTGGKHRATVAKIKEIHKIKSPQPNSVILISDKGEFKTISDYVFLIGEKKPLIKEVVEV